MTHDYLRRLDPARQQAVAELIARVSAQYPTATFVVQPGEDDPAATHITAMVETDDPDAVLELVLERELELQLEQGLPIYVIPIRTPARAAALRARHAQEPHRGRFLVEVLAGAEPGAASA
jgi:hypothetical protein